MNTRWIFILIELLELIIEVVGHCPRSCSGHGECTIDDKCVCFSGFFLPDCSARICPYGSAWSDKATPFLAHNPGECSNAGKCDRTTGLCNCFAGFQGISCAKLSCPNKCSNQGVCTTLKGLSRLYALSASDADGFGEAYSSNWDALATPICHCDDGFTGSDCSIKLCPFSDDPFTVKGTGAVFTTPVVTSGSVTSISVSVSGSGYQNPVVSISGDGTGATATANLDSTGGVSSVTITNGGSGYSTATYTIEDDYQNDFVVSLTTGAASGTLSGKMELMFMGKRMEFEADASSLDASQMQNLLTSAGSEISTVIGSVTVTRSAVDANLGAAYTITFSSFRSAGFSSLFNHMGSPSVRNHFRCSVAGVDLNSVTSPSCVVAVVQNTNVKEFLECSGRGKCLSGRCLCFSGYVGGKCEIDSGIISLVDSEPTYLIKATGLSFVGSVLKLASSKSLSTDFKFLEVVAGDSEFPLFDLLGNGQVQVHNGGIMVNEDGVVVKKDGLGVLDGGSVIYDSSSTLPTLIVSSQIESGFSGNVMVLKSTMVADSTFKLLQMQANSTIVLDVTGIGDVRILSTTAASSSSTGALYVAGGLGISKAGYFGTGLSVETGGINVLSDNLLFSSTGAQAVTHDGSGGGDLTVSSTNADVVIEAVTFTGAAISGASTIAASGDVTMSAGNLVLSSTSAQTITHTGAASQDLTISSTNGNLILESVTVNGAAVSGVSTVDASGDIALSGTGAQAVTHDGSGGGDLTVSSTNADVVIEAVTFTGAAISGASTIAASGDVTMSAGNLVLSSTSAQTITHTGAASQDLTISSTNGNLILESVTVNGAAVSGVSTVDASGDIALSGTGAQAVTHDGSGGGDLTVSSTNADVVIEAVTFTGAAISGASTIAASGDVTMSAGNLVLSSTSAQTITHTGAASQDLTISSTNGNLILESVTVNGAAVSGVSTVDASGDIALSGTGAQAVTHDGSGGGDLTVSSTNADVVIEAVTFTGAAISGASTIAASGDVTMSAGNLVLSSTSAQTITHTGAASQDLTISSTNGNLILESVTVNGAAVSGVSTVDASGDIALSGTGAQAVTHDGSGGGDLTVSSTNADVVIEAVTFTGAAISGASTIAASGDVTMSAGNLVLSSTSAQTITHTGAASQDLTISSTNGNLILESVTVNGAAVSGVSTVDASGDIALSGTGAQAVTHDGSGGGDLTVSSTNADVVIEAVRFTGAAISGASTIAASGDVTMSAGNLVLSSTSAQTITHTGAASQDLTISSTNGNLILESVTVNGAAVSGVSTVDASGDIALSGTGAQAVTHDGSGGGDLTVSSTNADVVIEAVTFTGAAISGASTIAASGDVTMSAGNLVLSSTSAQTITHTGAASQDLTISSTNGNLILESVTVNGAAVSGVSTVDASGDIALSGTGAQAVTHDGSGGGDLTVSSTNADVVIEAVTFTGAAISGASTIAASGDVTMSAGNLVLSSTSAQTITHTGAASQDLTISSTNGNLILESVTVNGAAVSGVSTLDASGDIALSGTGAQALTHDGSGGGDLTVSSTNADVVIEAVTFTGAAISGASTIAASGDVTMSAGNLVLSSTSTQTITHTGAASQDLTISSTNGNLILESVTVNGAAVSGVSTVDASGDIALSGTGAQAVTHDGSGGGDLTVSSTNADVVIEAVTFTGAAISGASTIAASGDVTMSAGNLVLSSTSAQTITHTGAASQDLTISSTNGNLILESVTVNGAAVSGVSTVDASGDIALSGTGAQAVTHDGSGGGDLTVSSTNADVVIEAVTFTGAAISGASTIAASGQINTASGSFAVGGQTVVTSQQAAETDVAATNDPGDGTIAGLTFSATYDSSEVIALRSECEKLRDFANDLRSTLNSLLSKLRTHGLIAT
eukprot:snap_masked-scaffold_19-processed-gene-3.19-mRNA-1 protein AED:0.01 eAED:0.01 QI:0/0/0/1/1/1/3/0/1884